MAVRVYGLGTVEARIVSDIGFEVGAALTDLAVDSGDAVDGGAGAGPAAPGRTGGARGAGRGGRRRRDRDAGQGRGKRDPRPAVLAQREATNARQQDLAGRSIASAQAAEEAQRDVDVAAADLAVARSEVEVARAHAQRCRSRPAV